MKWLSDCIYLRMFLKKTLSTKLMNTYERLSILINLFENNFLLTFMICGKWHFGTFPCKSFIVIITAWFFVIFQVILIKKNISKNKSTWKTIWKKKKACRAWSVAEHTKLLTPFRGFNPGQPHFKNFAAFAAKFLKCVWPFWDVMH